MIALIWALAVALVVVLVLIVLLLATPIVLAIQAITEPRPRLTLAARFMGGLSPRFVLYDSTWRSRKPGTVVQRQQRSRAKWRRTQRSTRMRLIRFLRAVPELGRAVLERFHFEHAQLDVTVGLDDPADTGQLFGLIAPLSHLTRNQALGRAIVIKPDFGGSRLAGRGGVVVHFIPASVVPTLIWLAWRVWGPCT